MYIQPICPQAVMEVLLGVIFIIDKAKHRAFITVWSKSLILKVLKWEIIGNKSIFKVPYLYL